MSMELSKITIEPLTPPTAAVIWLHGLGADGHDFEGIVPQLHLPKEKAIRFLFPHAPVRPVTLNEGYPMRAWYDILSFGDASPEDTQGIHETEQALHHLIHEQTTHGIPLERIILAGFSQGGAMALYTALRYPRRLAGVLALSTYLPLADTLLPATHAFPIFMAHGAQDTIVPFAVGRRARAQLEKLNYTVEWESYPMAHTVCMDEVKTISDWLQKIL